VVSVHLLHELQKQKDHLEEQNRWALGLEREWKAAQERIVELQDEFAAEQSAVEIPGSTSRRSANWRRTRGQKADWALETDRRLTAEIVDLRERFAETLERLEAAEATVIERTHWALDLQANWITPMRNWRERSSSRWVRAGRMFGVGPEL
jgi:hypothetical protein